MGKKAVDLSPLTQQLANHWNQGMTALTHSLQKVG